MALKITRENILEDSIREIEKNVNFEYVIYENENGDDYGGLLRDWLSTIGNRIIETGSFKIVPSKCYLTIDGENSKNNIVEFTGRLIAIAYNKKINLHLKFASFIWKLLKNEKITIDDMEEYDQSIYQSLKWILCNDVTEMDEYFVDQNDVELIPNGKNIKLTNNNKKEYVNQMLKRKLFDKNESLFNLLKNGFEETIIKDYTFGNIDALELRKIINGNEFIDVNDWEKNTERYKDRYLIDNEEEEDEYQYLNDDYINNRSEFYETVGDFFVIISEWSQEKLRKLLKFVTGLPVVPIGGFEYLEGGLFNIKISYNSDIYPEAHTCNNTLVLPSNNSLHKLEQKLLMAIEVVDFALN